MIVLLSVWKYYSVLIEVLPYHSFSEQKQLLKGVLLEGMKASHKKDSLINGINKYMWKNGEKAAGQMDSQWGI